MTTTSSEQTERLDSDLVAGLLQEDGPFAEKLKGFEAREQQQEMLHDIVDAYNFSKISLIEAGTGTGKSLAYLVPAMLWAKEHGERTVISTNTINLQEQLLEKDIPLAEKALGLDLKAVLIKGMSNYVCLRKLRDAIGEQHQFTDGEIEELQKIDAWSQQTHDGSRSDLDFHPSHATWDRVCAEGDACQANRCPLYEQCFFFKAREEASKADLLIANHHLLFADLSVRAETNNFHTTSVMPAYQRVILDEGHHIEDVATDHFARRISQTQILRVLNRLLAEKLDKGGVGKIQSLRAKVREMYPGDPSDVMANLLSRLDTDLPGERHEVGRRAVDAFQGIHAFVDQIANPQGRTEQGQPEEKLRFRQHHRNHPLWQSEVIPRVDQLLLHLEKFATSLSALGREIAAMDDESLTEATRSIVLDIEAMASRLEAAGQIVEAFVKHDEDPQKVCWVETHQRKGFLNTHLIIADLEIAQPLVESLFKPFRTVILTSATLTTNNNFEFMKHRLGVDNNELDCDRVDEAQYSSPFNYAEQAMLIVPRDIPDPNSRDFLPAACEKIWDAVLASRGNAFVLFTSYASLRACAQILEPKLRERRMALFKQGDDDRQTLLKSFRNTENSVLFGTDSFWEGVDVTGEALRCVILYKLPFQVPTDPLVQARTEAITAAGGKAFFEYSVPNAIVKFKQGFGRLIRHKKDRGVIVCLDNRLLTKGYGKMFINSLPPCQKQTTDKGELRKVMEQFYKKTYRLTR